MKELIDHFYDEARSAWRYRWTGMAIAAVTAVVAWLFVFSLPDKYEARASIFVDTRTALKPVLQGLTVEQDVDAQLNYVRQSLLSGESLERIARESGLLTPQTSDPQQKAQILGPLASQIVIGVRNANGKEEESNSPGKIYTFTYQDKSRERSLKVTETAFKTFIEDTLGGKREGSQSAQKFLETQIKSYEDRLRTAENRLADFKKNNIGLMPSERGDYFSQLQGEIDATRKAENDLSVAVSRRGELARQLRGDSAITAGSASSTGSAGTSGGDTLSRIKEAQARLDELLLRYTDKHPDVVAMRATLVELKRRRDAEIESLRRGDAGTAAMSGVSSNPVYQAIQLQLNQADVEIASLRGQVAQHRAKAAELRQRLDSAPRVEAEYAQLNRDYDINKAQYTALLANYEKSQLGEKADSAGSVRFEIVQPVTAGYNPVSPKRSLLLGGSFVLALVVGGLVCYLLHLLSPVVCSSKGLTELTGMSVLGTVSAAFPARLHEQGREDMLRFGLAIAGLAAAFALVVILSWQGVRLPNGHGGI